MVGYGSANPLDLLSYGLRVQDAEAGRKIGVMFGEEFRWVRYHPLIEAALAAEPPAQAERRA